MENEFKKAVDLLNSIEDKEINCVMMINNKPVYGKLTSGKGNALCNGYSNICIGEKSLDFNKTK